MATLTRRGILKNMTAALAMATTGASLSSPPIPLKIKPKNKWKNWAGNQHSSPERIVAPNSESELIGFLKGSAGTVRPVGSGHSWSGLVPTDGTLVSMGRLNGLIDHNPDTLQAQVWGDTKLFSFGPLMDSIGQSIMNMSDIDYQSMAGAVATSTHGTGANLGCISSYVCGLRLVTPNGEVIDCSKSRDADVFNAARTSLGSLGVITRLTFQNREKHRLHQREWLAVTDEVLEDVDALKEKHQQFELFPIPNSNRSLVVVTNEASPDAVDTIINNPSTLNDLKEGFDLTRKLPFAENVVFNNVLDFMADDESHRIGPSYKVLAHPRTQRFMEMEYTVPAKLGVQCVREVLKTIREKAPNVVFPLEFRYVKSDTTQIGMFSERNGCSISVHQFADDPKWQAYLAMIEPVFHKYQGRPHWGKWHSLKEKEFAKLYPLWSKFKRIRSELDPKGRMLNAHLTALFVP